jgi:hypothetical protein
VFTRPLGQCVFPTIARQVKLDITGDLCECCDVFRLWICRLLCPGLNHMKRLMMCLSWTHVNLGQVFVVARTGGSSAETLLFTLFPHKNMHHKWEAFPANTMADGIVRQHSFPIWQSIKVAHSIMCIALYCPPLWIKGMFRGKHGTKQIVCHLKGTVIHNVQYGCQIP